MKLTPILMAGGGGTRLWPLSREHYPKQFLQLFENNTLFQNTLLRLEGLEASIEVSTPVIICNEAHRFLVVDQGLQISKKFGAIILEPEGRNTAPALTIAALNQYQNHGDSIIIMMPSDHVIKEIKLFHQAVKAGVEMANDNYLVTFGIKPTQAETGYGYIQTAKKIQTHNNQDIFSIGGFTEKPDISLAKKYFDSGNYLWNSGIYMMKASVWLNKIQQHQKSIYAACSKAFKDGKTDGVFFRLDEKSFCQSPNDSIDYAVMEKLSTNDNEKLAVLPVDIGWSDVGAWSSVMKIKNKDTNKNHIEGDVVVEETNNCFIRSERGLIATIGCEDMIIIDSDDAILIADKNKTQDIKKIVNQLKKNDRNERITHRKNFRPWGHYDTIDIGKNFQVKRLTVYPGKRLSLQLHHKRSEHWVVVKGIATVTKGEDEFLLHENESTYIPPKTKHRLENAGDNVLEIIEVQSGSYLGEDDIVRYDDDFGR